MNVRFFYGTKQQFLDMKQPREEFGLYFCTDTREIYCGDSLYTSAIEKVSVLPEFKNAADGVIYCVDDGNAYYLNTTRDGWEKLSFSMPEGYATEEYVDKKFENFWKEEKVYKLDGGKLA